MTTNIKDYFKGVMIHSTLEWGSRIAVQQLIINRLNANKAVLNTIFIASGHLPLYVGKDVGVVSKNWDIIVKCTLMTAVLFNLRQLRTGHQFYPLKQSGETIFRNLAFQLTYRFLFQVGVFIVEHKYSPTENYSESPHKIAYYGYSFFSSLLSFPFYHALSYQPLKIDAFVIENIINVFCSYLSGTVCFKRHKIIPVIATYGY